MAKTRAAGALASVVVGFRFGGGVAVIVCAIFYGLIEPSVVCGGCSG
jgi:hypothetical protein